MYVVIAGGGKIGEYLANVLLESGNDVTIIEEDLETADRLSVVLQGRYLVIHGDGCDSKYQEDAGIRRADVFVATTGQDDDNLVSCEIAQRVFNVPRCIARVNSPKNLRIFHEVGIECVSSTTLIANLIEEETLLGSVSVVSSLTHGNVMLTEVVVPRMRHHSNDAGVLASAIPLPPDSIIAAVASSDNVEVVNEDTVMFPGDKAIVVADNQVIDAVPRSKVCSNEKGSLRETSLLTKGPEMDFHFGSFRVREWAGARGLSRRSRRAWCGQAPACARVGELAGGSARRRAGWLLAGARAEVGASRFSAACSPARPKPLAVCIRTCRRPASPRRCCRRP